MALAAATGPEAASTTKLGSPLRGLAARAPELWRTTPGQLRMARVVLALLILATGALGALQASARIGAVRDITTRDEPLNGDVIEAYRRLAAADVTAAAGFLPSSPASPADARRYADDIDRAAASLAEAAGRSGGRDLTLDRISDISAALSVYTGLVAGARADSRSGIAGGAEFDQASELMHSTLLRRAQALQRDEAQQLAAQHLRAEKPPLIALGCGLMTAAVLLIVQIRLFRKTRRIFNVGLVTATAAVFGLMLWWAVAFSISQDHLADSRRHTRSLTDGWGQAQIAARQARASEILALVGDKARTDFHEEQFSARVQRLSRADGAGGAIGAARHLGTTSDSAALVNTAVAQSRTWVTAHTQIRELIDSNRRDEAIALAVGPSAAAFDRLDLTLARAADAEQDAFEQSIRSARRALNGLVAGTILLAVIGLAGAARGIGNRLEDYR